MTCGHRCVVKRPESGPGSRKPGEWFCLNCDAYWDDYTTIHAENDAPPEVLVALANMAKAVALNGIEIIDGRGLS